LLKQLALLNRSAGSAAPILPEIKAPRMGKYEIFFKDISKHPYCLHIKSKFNMSIFSRNSAAHKLHFGELETSTIVLEQLLAGIEIKLWRAIRPSH